MNQFPLLLLLLAGQDGRVGEVVFHNDTASPIKVTAQSTRDGRDVRSPLKGAWHLNPRDRTPLRLDGRPVVCHAFHFRLTTYEGSSDWFGTATGDRPGPCVVTVNEATLLKHRNRLLSGGERLRRPTGRVKVSNPGGRTWTLTCRGYLDAHNDRRAVRGGPWTINGGTDGYLDDLRAELPVARFEFTLTTAEGDSPWFVEAGADGDIPLVLDAGVYRQHLAAIGAGQTEPRALAGVTEQALARARERILAAVRDAGAGPGGLSEALTHGGSGRRDRVAMEQLRAALPAHSPEELRAVLGVLLRVQSGALRPARGEVRAVITALRRAGVRDPEAAAGFVMRFAGEPALTPLP